MIRRYLAVTALCLVATGAAAQMESDSAREATERSGVAVLRGLDKTSGHVRDIELAVGETVALGRLQVTLGECRYPLNNPAGNAYAYLVIRDGGEEKPTFAGWMIAASPALNALEHPRYDVWVMRCTT